MHRNDSWIRGILVGKSGQILRRDENGKIDFRKNPIFFFCPET
jgi:hypothetical protein